MKGPYTVLLLDAQGCELSNTEQEAFRLARLSITEKSREPDHRGGWQYQDAVRAKIIDATGACVHDVALRFPPPPGKSGRHPRSYTRAEFMPEEPS